MKEYVIFGCSSYVNYFLDIISAQGDSLKKIVCQDTQTNKISNYSFPVSIEPLEAFVPGSNESYICSIFGSQAINFHQKIRAKTSISFDTLIHPSSLISQTANLSSGSVISAGAILASNVVIGENSFIGQGTIFGHDTVVESDVIVESGVKLAGHIRVGKCSLIGMGAAIIEDVLIGENAIVEPGSVVLNDIPPQSVVSGIPASFKKINS